MCPVPSLKFFSPTSAVQLLSLAGMNCRGTVGRLTETICRFSILNRGSLHLAIPRRTPLSQTRHPNEYLCFFAGRTLSFPAPTKSLPGGSHRVLSFGCREKLARKVVRLGFGGKVEEP